MAHILLGYSLLLFPSRIFPLLVDHSKNREEPLTSSVNRES